MRDSQPFDVGWEDHLRLLLEKATAGESNDPRRAAALMELNFLVARQQLSAAAAAERAASDQLQVAQRQARYAMWATAATVALVIATILLVVATVSLAHNSSDQNQPNPSPSQSSK